MIKFFDKKNRFAELFNSKTGFYTRTGIINENGEDTNIDPFMRCFPGLIDVGIMQKCICANHCKVDCYQKAIDRTGDNMSLIDFESICKQSAGKVFQCLEENEIVLRKDSCGGIGSIYIKDVKVGDMLYCGNNRFAKVYEKNQKMSEIYNIDVGYGKHIKATKEHRFLTSDGLKSVGEMSIGDTIMSVQNEIFRYEINTIDIVKKIIELGLDDKYFIASCIGLDDICKKYNIKKSAKYKSVKISSIKNYLDEIDYSNGIIIKERSQYHFKAVYSININLMKLLGHYIGNGSHRSYTISKNQARMIETIENALASEFPNVIYTKKIDRNTCKIELNSTLIHKDLFDMFFECRQNNGDKQLPNFIYGVSNEMKNAFLSGYFCDGNIKANTNDGKYGVITFNTSSEKLSKDLSLLLSLMNIDYSYLSYVGEQSQFSQTDTRIINRRKRYRISIGNLIELFKIQNVVDDHKNCDTFKDIINSPHDNKDLRYRKPYIIRNITKEINPSRVVDINIDSNDHLFITSHGIITHNCALGGAGDPDTHENFKEILMMCKEYSIVPNFTTSGIAMTPEKAKLCKEYCGAVAVSFHPNGSYDNGECDYTKNAIRMLVEAGVKTNIHYVLGANSIDYAIKKLQSGGFEEGINAVVFLLYKPIGLGRMENILTTSNPKVKEFFEVIDTVKFTHKIGFDSCSCGGIVNFTHKVDMNSIDFCEGGRYSMYIDAHMNAMPCSFGNQDSKYYVDLHTHTIQEAWDGEVFEAFRSSLKNSCASCKNRSSCGGGCPICRDIVLCNRAEKDFK